MRLPLLAFTLAACATTEPRPTREQACHGTGINLDRVGDICAAPPSTKPPPSAASLEADIRPLPLHVQVGDVLRPRVRLTNVTADPLEVDIGLGCPAFVVSPLRDDGTAGNRMEGDSTAAPCPAGSTAHVTLEPSGWVEKEVAFTASKIVIDCSQQPKQPCREVPAAEMEPGTYRLQVTLPFTDPVPDKPGETALRVVEAPVVVTAAPR
jgi:hypothetical protein